jgi:tetratricopeptide (TPR) repeat protein
VRAFIQNSLLTVAHWLGERGHDAASAGLYSALADYEPDGARNAYLRYRALLQEGRKDEALTHLEQALTLAPDSARTRFEYGLRLQELGRHADAIEAFDRAMSIDETSSEGHASRGFSLMQLGRWPEAEAALRRAIRHDVRHRAAWHDLGMTLAQLERFDEAVAALRTALAIAPDTATSVGLAYILESLERFPEAEQVLREALRVDPQNALVISILAGVLLQQERPAEATTVLRDADARLSNHPAIVGALVWTLLGEDEPHEATAVAERLVSIDRSAYAEAVLSWTYLKSGRPTDAARVIAEARLTADTEGDPTIDRDDLDGIRAAVLSATGGHREALALFGRLRAGAFSRNPDLEVYREASRNATDGVG